jgi:hypothetical protein
MRISESHVPRDLLWPVPDQRLLEMSSPRPLRPTSTLPSYNRRHQRDSHSTRAALPTITFASRSPAKSCSRIVA